MQAIAGTHGKDDLTPDLLQAPYRAEAMPSGEDPGGETTLRLVPILSAALGLRVLAMMLMFRADPALWFYNQGSELNCLARSVLAGQGLSSPFGGSTGPSAFLAPGYPLLVALVYRAFGVCSLHSAVLLAGLQVILGVMTVLLAMLVAKRLFGKSTAHLAGALCAISPTMVWLPALFWETSLSTFFLIGVLALALLCAEHPRPSRWLAMGACSGLAMLFNPALLLTFAGLGAWAAFAAGRPSGRAKWLAAVACAAVFVAWPIRNAAVFHAFVPLRSNLGYELWQGNRPGSNGFFAPELHPNANREQYNRYAAIGELPYMREKSDAALASIKADPLRFVRLSLKRAGVFWTALGGQGISWVVAGEITLASALGIAGLMLLLARDKRHGVLLSIPFLVFPLPYYLTHPDFRFRLLLEPVALLLAAWFLREGWSCLESRAPIFCKENPARDLQ